MKFNCNLLVCICCLTCSAVEYMINCVVAPCVKTYCLIPAFLLVLVIGFSSLAVQNSYAGRFCREFLLLQGRFEHYARLLKHLMFNLKGMKAFLVLQGLFTVLQSTSPSNNESIFN